MKKRYLFLLLLTSVILIFVSCGTGPDAVALQQAMDNSQVARDRALDFGSQNYFPSEWEAIQAQIEAAETVEELNAATEALDELFRRTIPLYAQAREDEIMAARDELVSTGFTGVFPDYLRAADNIACEAQEQFEAGEHEQARETAARALNEYTDLLFGARVYLARESILSRGFYQFDNDNFLRADEVAIAAIEEFEAGNREAALANAEEALLRYNIVLSTGWTAFSHDRQESAVSERDLALTDRANIAARETFREGEALFEQAERLFAEENFHDASIAHIEAEAMFAIARQETVERRERAEEAIRLANERIEQINEAAIEAERLIEGGPR